jgi:hypothetical protein
MSSVFAAQAICGRKCRDLIGAVAPRGTIAKSNDQWLYIVRYWQNRGVWSETMYDIARRLHREDFDDAMARRAFADECRRVRLARGPLTDFPPPERRLRKLRTAIRNEIRSAREQPGP